MPRFRVRLIDVMTVVAFAAIVFGLKAHLDRTRDVAEHAHDAPVAIYVSALSTALIAARAGRPRWRRFWGGVALFGGIYLVIGMRLAWGVSDYIESESLVFRCRLALPLGLLCGLAAHWLVPDKPSNPDAARALSDATRA